jgi:hypothetical protein
VTRRRPLPRRLRRAMDAFLAACLGRAFEKLAREVPAPRAALVLPSVSPSGEPLHGSHNGRARR